MRTGRKCPGYLDTRPAGSPASLPSSPPQIGGSEASQALIYLVPALVDKQGNRGVHFNGIVPHIVNFNRQHFPSRAGHNAALDAAMSCAAGGIRQLLRGECSKQSGSYYYLVNPSTELIRSHTSAVAALRYSLDDAKQSATAEILLAAFLLCCFEVRESCHIMSLCGISTDVKKTNRPWRIIVKRRCRRIYMVFPRYTSIEDLRVLRVVLNTSYYVGVYH